MKKYSGFFIALLLSTIGFAQDFQAKETIEILWGGTWYKGSVVEVKGDQYKVHYDGWGSSWDEWVKKERLRKPAITPTAAATNKPAAETLPPAVVKQTYSGTNGKLYLALMAVATAAAIRWILTGFFWVPMEPLFTTR